MNTRDLLNKFLYPSVETNVRRKDFPLYDRIVLATGVTEYFFFVTALGNQFQRNKRLPLAGTEVFFVDAISGFFQRNVDTLTIGDVLNEMLQQSYLQISVDNRVVAKLPGMDFIQWFYSDTFSVVGVVAKTNASLLKRKLPIPILMNSTSAFEYKFVTTTGVAANFSGLEFHLVLHGLQLDKLESFYWDNLKDKMFQQISATYYNTVPIVDGTETTYQLFADQAQAKNLFSQTFPLSDIQTMSVQNIEVRVNQPNIPIDPLTIYNSRVHNVLKISIDDIDYYSANLQDRLSIFAGVAGGLTTTPDISTVMWLNINQSKTLSVPIEIPANSKVNIRLTQPASSLGVTGEITVALRGVETRRVA